MGLSGLFLITFLIVHVGINALVFLGNNGEKFLEAAHFMGTNPLMRTLEIGLVLGFLIHIIDGYYLTYINRKARPQGYFAVNAKVSSPWYSRSMAVLGSLLLIFLIIHAADFWIPNRYNQLTTGEELNLYEKMKLEFQSLPVVILYVLSCISLFWHLLHGFKSSFQSIGINHPKVNGFIEYLGLAFSVIVPFVFAIIPIAFHLGVI